MAVAKRIRSPTPPATRLEAGERTARGGVAGGGTSASTGRRSGIAVGGAGGSADGGAARATTSGGVGGGETSRVGGTGGTTPTSQLRTSVLPVVPRATRVTCCQPASSGRAT